MDVATPPKPRRKPTPNLTPAEAKRALYIDFEGRKGHPPELLGVTTVSGGPRATKVWQYVTDPRFGSLVDGTGIVLLPLPEAIERILVRARSKNRLIVAWSIHELDIVREYSPDHLEEFEARFVNAKRFAVRWRNSCHGGRRPPTNQLADFMKLIGYAVPERAGPGRAAETIKIIHKAFAKGRSAAELTPNQKQRWLDLREHNRHDCAAMRRICRLAADDLAAAGLPASDHRLALRDASWATTASRSSTDVPHRQMRCAPANLP